MNIFILSRSAARAARAHCDTHVVKMILETAQLLSTAHHELGATASPIYKATHRNHPCAIWARTNKANYMWLHALGMELCKEYTHRYGKTHKTESVMRGLRKLPKNIPRSTRKTPFAQAMPDVYRSKHPVQSYRRYYREEKRRLLKYTNRSTPRWV